MKKITFVVLCIFLVSLSTLMFFDNEEDVLEEEATLIKKEVNKVSLEPIEDFEDFEDFKSKVNYQLEEYKSK